MKYVLQLAGMYDGIFNIDVATGIITQLSPLNYENLTFYQYELMAKVR